MLCSAGSCSSKSGAKLDGSSMLDLVTFQNEGALEKKKFLCSLIVHVEIQGYACRLLLLLVYLYHAFHTLYGVTIAGSMKCTSTLYVSFTMKPRVQVLGYGHEVCFTSKHMPISSCVKHYLVLFNSFVAMYKAPVILASLL